MPNRRLPPLAVVLALLGGCAATQLPTPDVEQRITDAERSVSAGAWDEVLDTLAPVEGELCPKRLRDRRDVALATAWYGLGEAWTAFEILELFPDEYPHSELRPTVVEMLFQIGRTLAARDGGFLFFWSDRRGARTVLEHLITRHPDTQRLADALRLLGDMAYEDRDYELAQQRFRDLMLNRPESEWVVYAQFRFAMAIVDSLQGADYDLDRMEHAVRELDAFLAAKPENPKLVADAVAARARLLEWQVERHLLIAAFYKRVGNVDGRRYHLDIAAGSGFASTEAHARALEARDELAQELADAQGQR